MKKMLNGAGKCLKLHGLNVGCVVYYNYKWKMTQLE